MDSWKDAWVIFKKDLRNDRLFLIWNVIFMLYVTLMLGSLVGAREETRYVMNPMSDFLMLMMVPFTGFFFTRRSFNYIKEDSYTQMLRFYRVLPIPLKTVIRSRLIQLGAAMLLNGILFYGGFYLVTYLMNGSAPGFGTFAAFCLTWVGYGLLINGLFIYCELLMKGTVYLWLTFLLMLVLGGGAILTNWLGGNLLSFTLESSRRYVLLSPLMWGSLAGGGLGLALLCSVTLRKLTKRNLA
ncbi:hypothetical protein [uncultured Paenibacillus sp.]|uniref:hypothetical protein n=1 Tax=uncultured Paenibacillus sp. TaxID=227322 RepID=UPI0015ABA23B|nr:hypothetical protein [uncultured Paenibacillus sp.]